MLLRLPLLTILLISMAACTKTAAPNDDAIIVFNAGSLARPLRAALDSFTAGTKIRIEQENAGSVETARKLTSSTEFPISSAPRTIRSFPST